MRSIDALDSYPLINEAYRLFRRLNPLAQGSMTAVTSSQQFLRKIDGFQLESNDVMLSFDVTSLFTSPSANLARKTIELRLSGDEQCKQDVTILDLIQLLNF